MISFANMLPITIFSQFITSPTLPAAPPVILTVTKTSALAANVCPANFSTPSSVDGTYGANLFSLNAISVYEVAGASSRNLGKTLRDDSDSVVPVTRSLPRKPSVALCPRRRSRRRQRPSSRSCRAALTPRRRKRSRAFGPRGSVRPRSELKLPVEIGKDSSFTI